MINIVEETKKIGIKKRIELVHKIWDGIVEETQEIPVPDWHKEELERRNEKYMKNPESGLSWEKVKENIRDNNV